MNFSILDNPLKFHDKTQILKSAETYDVINSYNKRIESTNKLSRKSRVQLRLNSTQQIFFSFFPF